jgi:hypothetical protein
VYATHGHYLDCHVSSPRPEAIAAGVMKRLTGGILPGPVDPAGYERVLAPLYAFWHERAQSGALREGTGVTRKLRGYGWQQLARSNGAGPGSIVGRAVLRTAIFGLNRARLGRFDHDLSGDALCAASVVAMGEVVARLGIGAEHVVFGHSHRAGPLPGDSAWRSPDGVQLTNTGSWVVSPEVIGAPAGPYWPGSYVRVRETGPPEIVHLLTELPSLGIDLPPGVPQRAPA